MSNSDSKIEEFKKLIREHGIRKATSIIDAKGITYSEDFTDLHTSDPIFSNPSLSSRKNTVMTKLFDLKFSSSILDGITIKELDREQIMISTNEVSYIDDIDVSVESGTEMNVEQTAPNVTTQST